VEKKRPRQRVAGRVCGLGGRDDHEANDDLVFIDDITVGCDVP
jgi:hypothetical protein